MGAAAAYSEWITIEDLGAPTYISATQVSYADPSGVLPDILLAGGLAGRPIKMAAGTTAYGHVDTCVNAAGVTTITVIEGNVPADITACSYHFMSPRAGYTPIVKKAGAPPAWNARYEGITFINTSLDLTYVGCGFWLMAGGPMKYPFSQNAVAVGAGATVTVALDFNTPTTLTGRLMSLVVVGAGHANNGCNNFDLKVYTKTPTGVWVTDRPFCVFEQDGYNGELEPFGCVEYGLNLAVDNVDPTTTDALWLTITNNDTGSANFDVAAALEHIVEG